MVSNMPALTIFSLAADILHLWGPYATGLMVFESARPE